MRGTPIMPHEWGVCMSRKPAGARPKKTRSNLMATPATVAPRKSARAAVSRDETMRGMKRALVFLQHIALNPSRAVDVTKRMGLPWATVYRTLTQLEEAQFLRRDPVTNRYEIGAGLWFIGTAYVANHPVLRAAFQYLYHAERIPGIVVQLTEAFGFQAVNIFSAQPLAEEITKAHYGFHFPLHCGSKGRVLLAFSDKAFIDRYLSRPLERLTEETVTDPDEIRKELAVIRKQGWSLTIGDVQPFTGSIAAPIRDAEGKVVASMCFVAKRTVIADEAKRVALLEELLRSAHATSINLGWRPGQF